MIYLLLNWYNSHGLGIHFSGFAHNPPTYAYPLFGSCKANNWVFILIKVTPDTSCHRPQLEIVWLFDNEQLKDSF
jgi:hypothetical protein